MPAPTRIKLLEIPAWGLFRAHLEPPAPSGSHTVPQAGWECGRRSLWPSPSLLQGRNIPTHSCGASGWLGHPSGWCPVLAATVLRAWGVPGSPLSSSLPVPSLTQHPCHPPRAGTCLGVGAGATGVPLALPHPSDVCLFVCLFCPVPPHWSPVSMEVGGPWAASAPPSPAPPAPLGCV